MGLSMILTIKFRWRVIGEGYDNEDYDLCEESLKDMIKSIHSQARKEKQVAKSLTLVTVAQRLILMLGI